AAGTTAHAVIVGAGARLGQLRARVRELALTAHVTFKDFVPAHDLPLTLGLADLALVTLRPGFEGVIVPSKLVGYMARGVPVLYVGPPSDISTLLGAAQCGAWVHPGEFAACSELLRRAVAQPKELQRWGENGLRYYSAQLAAEHGLRRYVELVGQCLPASAPQDTP
ncbi:MAG: glycosyltransferase, partial [Gammaproteobacteria bacterium]|nr:glycosyltransferase [Gammaproteobacteria bacterium]